MKLRIALASIVAATTLPAFSADGGLLLAMRIERDGRVLSTPTVWVESGKDAAVQVDNALRVEINATDLGASADMRLRLFTSSGGDMMLAASPRLVGKLAEESAVRFTGADGMAYSVSLKPARTVRP